MALDAFQKECDRLSGVVDDVQFERFRWARDEAPKLARLVELTRGAFEKREDFDLTEEGATTAEKGFVLKIHGNRIIAIAVSLQEGMAVIRPSTIERSPYTLTDAQPISVQYDAVDEQWINETLQQIFGRIGSAHQEAVQQPVEQVEEQQAPPPASSEAVG